MSSPVHGVDNLWFPDRPLRRVRRVLVDAQGIIGLFKRTEHPDCTECFRGLPADARVVGIGVEGTLSWPWTFEIYVESAEFSEVESGRSVPTLEVTAETYYYGPGVLAALRDAAERA